MKREYGYCRISTPQQNIERQERNIKDCYPKAHITKEAFTGTKMEGRKELDKILKQVRPGDTIIFDSVSRMSRNAEEGIRLYQELFDKGVDLVFLKEPAVNTAVYREALERQISVSVETGDNATDTFIKSIMDALKQFQKDLAAKQIRIAFDQAEKEVMDLRQRTKEGIETARRNGKQIGQQEGKHLTTKKSVQAKEVIKEYCKDFGGTISDKVVMQIAGVSRNSFYKYKRELKEEFMKEANEFKIITYFENGMTREDESIATEMELEERIEYLNDCLRAGTKLNVCRPDGSSLTKIEVYSHDRLINIFEK